jgi:2-polyprenylphenol 6-hydroxylase
MPVATGNSFDVIVVGGGPVGWACALAVKKKTASVCVIDRAGIPKMPSGAMQSRVYTVTQDHLLWLDELDVALDKARCAEVDRIRVFTQSGLLALNIDSRDARKMRLAKVVEHEHLSAATAARALQVGVQYLQSEVVASGALDAYRYVELADGSLLNAKLVVFAQGTDTMLLDTLHIQSIRRDYERVAVVANFTTENAHRGAAQQWFLPDQSILALLPLPDAPPDTEPIAPPQSNNAYRSSVSMVWSTTVSHAAALKAMSETELCAAVSQATGNALRVSSVIAACKQFPLQLVRVADPVAERALVVGDAAHAVHPLAGQGVNLGLGDAIALGEALSFASQVDDDVGHALLLAKYRRSRYAAVATMQAATDGLARIYNLSSAENSSPLLPSASVGDLGMRVLGTLPAFRRILSSAAS